MKQILILITLLSITSCKPEISLDSLHKTYDFSIQLPKNWKHEKLQGTDSRIGIFTNETDTLTYDFGWYTSGFEFQYGKNPEYSIQKVTIDNKTGQFLFPKNNLKGTTGIFLQVDEYNTLTIWANVKNPKNYYWDIFKTITFTGK